MQFELFSKVWGMFDGNAPAEEKALQHGSM
jgi:hypothetical protein